MDDVNPEVFMAYLIQFDKFVAFDVNQSFTNSTLTCNISGVLFSSNFNITCSAQKMWLWSHLLKNSLKENFIFCAKFGSKAKNLMHFTPTATRLVLCEKMFLEISQNSQENTCARVSFLTKLQA